MRQAPAGPPGPEALAELSAGRCERLGVAPGGQLAQPTPGRGALGREIVEAQGQARTLSWAIGAKLPFGAAPAQGRGAEPGPAQGRGAEPAPARGRGAEP
ncbi:MAG TPA: hypothetical protein VFS00_35130, partial [Polyangiaceae bacterium]|nr:hypothetical protein [Polyangiaceae bacterium]